MRFTFTFYIGRKTFTLSLVVKSNNRHPWPVTVISLSF